MDLKPEFFRRIDETADSVFYEMPRLVVHIDDQAVAAVRGVYARELPQGGRFLDFMSSYRSHLAPQKDARRVYGLGLNRVEMKQNPDLDEIIIHDTNKDSPLPFADKLFDGAMLAVSVQYLIRPVQIFKEIARILKSGAPFIVTYSNRCFPTKAVAIWHPLDDHGHGKLIQQYFKAAGSFTEPVLREENPDRSEWQDPLYSVVARRVRGPG
jgi:SAM-dependent methyltransferase